MSVYSIPAGAPFLDVLARAIFDGVFGPAPKPEELPFWTLYVPTKRAAPLLAAALVRASGGTAVLLPRIHSLGEDDDELDSEGDLTAEKIGKTGILFVLMRLAGDWARDNAGQPLAQEITASPIRLLDLAVSMFKLFDQLEAGEATLEALPKLLERELSEHREAIIGFLALLTERLPSLMRDHGWVSERRLQRLRHDRTGQRLKAEPPRFPVIAAGSTGSVPATARLLAAISGLEAGAVVLPGLDVDLDETGWAAIGDTHPQAAMKPLLAAMGIGRRDVKVLGPGRPRTFLASEIMRPSEAADLWREVIAARTQDIRSGVENVALVEAPSRRLEAAAIALILRAALEDKERSAALITPDRDLARQVRSELRRWHIVADDTGGEPLSRAPQGSFIAALAGLLKAGAREVELASLLGHPLLALDAEAARHFEIGVIRRGQWRGGLAGLFESAVAAEEAAKADRHAHGAAKRITAEAWHRVTIFARNLQAALTGDTGPPLDRLRQLIATLTRAGDFWSGAAGEELGTLIMEFEDHAAQLPPLSFDGHLALLLRLMDQRTLRVARGAHPRLKIYGLLEARLVDADWIVLGGLNENVWPGQPDPGPWLNRPMRQDLAMTMPERQIGLAAHDFAQGFAGGERVFLTWSKRLRDAPAPPSRWVLRLKTLMDGAEARTAPPPWVAWAAALDAAGVPVPAPMPQPCPPAAARPRQFSVTDVETLIRDPYGIYARKVLRLRKIDPLRQGPDAALRGKLIHEALNRFAVLFPSASPENGREELLAIGRAVFAPLMGEPDVAGFWWPRFQRIAAWFADHDRLLRDNVTTIHSEVEGEWDFPAAGEACRLTARADRIDMLNDGSARIIDYKTGSVPSAKQVKAGLAPQLTLEAAMLARGAFKDIGAADIDAAMYIKLSGARVQGKETAYQKSDLGELPAEHLGGFTRLLADYARETQPYIPRALMEKDKDASDYDHLSRYAEWAREGGDGE